MAGRDVDIIIGAKATSNERKVSHAEAVGEERGVGEAEEIVEGAAMCPLGQGCAETRYHAVCNATN